MTRRLAAVALATFTLAAPALADEAAIRPELATQPFHFREGKVLLRPLGAATPDPERPGHPRVDYDIPHRKPWGFDLVIYLLTKGISTGALMLSALLWMLGDRSVLVALGGPVISAIFTLITAVVLVIDLEQPQRFLMILTRPNWTSWLARGAFLLGAHGAIAGLWLALQFSGQTAALSWLAPVAFAVALAATAYTGFLFAQGLARDLWQGPHSTIDLVAQAIAEGSAALLIFSFFTGADTPTIRALALALALASVAHLSILVLEHLVTPSPTVHHELAVRAVRSGPYSALFWIGALGMGGLVPLAAVWLASTTGFPLAILVPAALIALAGCLAWEYIWVEAGQSVPNS